MEQVTSPWYMHNLGQNATTVFLRMDSFSILAWVCCAGAARGTGTKRGVSNTLVGSKRKSPWYKRVVAA